MKNKINDNKMLKMVDQNYSQVKIAEFFGVSKQAVNKRLIQLKGRSTKVIVTKKVKKSIDDRLDSISQLKLINDEAIKLLNELEQEPALKLKVMSEIRGQLKLQIEIFQTLFSLQTAEEFQTAVLEAIGEASPDVRKNIINRLNVERSIRSAVKFS